MVTISPSELQVYVFLPRPESAQPVANTTLENIGTYVEAIEKQKKSTLVNGPNADDEEWVRLAMLPHPIF